MIPDHTIPEPLTEAEQAECRTLTHIAERGGLGPDTFARLVDLNVRQAAAAEPGSAW